MLLILQAIVARVHPVLDECHLGLLRVTDAAIVILAGKFPFAVPNGLTVHRQTQHNQYAQSLHPLLECMTFVQLKHPSVIYKYPDSMTGFQESCKKRWTLVCIQTAVLP